MGMIILNGKEYTSMPKDGFPPLIYSDEEREVGVWRDGKPLYQKCYPITIAQGNIQSIDSTFEPKKVEVATYYDSQSVFENSFIYDSNNLVTVWIGQGYIQCHSHSIYNGKSAVVILYYTKTTDVAGSGKYTTYGGLTHHYSETEQVIGTWIDGKPIYERVIDFTEFQGSTNRWITTPVNIPNGEYVVSCGFAQHPSLSSNFLYWVFCRFDSSGNLQAWFNGSTYYYARCKIQYTKTTD